MGVKVDTNQGLEGCVVAEEISSTCKELFTINIDYVLKHIMEWLYCMID